MALAIKVVPEDFFASGAIAGSTFGFALMWRVGIAAKSDRVVRSSRFQKTR